MGGRGSAGRAHAVTAGSTPLQALQPPTEQADQPDPTPPPPEKAPDPVDPRTAAVNRRWDKAVHDVLTDLVPRGDWADLVDLRAALDARGVSRDAQDAHLKRLSREGALHIVPESNRKVLTEADHAASIRIGGEENNLVMWNPTRPGPEATARPDP